MPRLTDRSVSALKPNPGKRVATFDTVVPGLCVRCTPTGHKTFALVTRFRGKQRWITLGRVGAITLANARDLAREALSRAHKGEDPRRRRSDTFAEIAARFVVEYARPRNRSWHETERIFRKYCGAWAARDVADITRRDVRELVETVAGEHGGIMSNRVLSTIRRMFTWALERDIIGESPAQGVRPLAKEVSRDRVLSDAELRAYWKATGALAYPWGPYFRVLALSGQRLSEAAGMRWSDVDIDRALWTIPAEANKSGRLHEVPLSEPVVDILRAVPRHSGPYVFTTGNGTVPISGIGRPKAALAEAMNCGNWTLHDLRRTFATTAARLGYPPHVIEKVLNHTSGSIRGVAAIYNRYSFDKEKRDALIGWGKYLVALVAPDRG
jgi:integrase